MSSGVPILSCQLIHRSLYALAMAFFVNAAILQADALSPDELLRRCDNATKLSAVAMKLQTAITWNSDSKSTIHEIFLYRRNSRNWIDTTAYQAKPGDPGSIDLDAAAERRLILENQVLSYHIPPHKRPIMFITSDSEIKEVARLRSIDMESYERGEFLNGRISGLNGTTVFQALIGTGASVQDDKIGDLSCRRVDGKCRFGTISVWIVPSLGFNPVKYIVDRTGADSWNNGSLSELADDAHGNVTSARQELDSVNISQIDGRFLVTSGRMVRQFTYSKAKPLAETYLCERSDVGLHPDFDALRAFVIEDVRNGTKAFTEDSGKTGIIYEWRNGGIIPRIDRDLVNQIDATTQSLSDHSAGVDPKLAGR
jgi:hypothetical protein